QLDDHRLVCNSSSPGRRTQNTYRSKYRCRWRHDLRSSTDRCHRVDMKPCLGPSATNLRLVRVYVPDITSRNDEAINSCQSQYALVDLFILDLGGITQIGV